MVAAAGPADSVYWAGEIVGGMDGYAWIQRRIADGGLDTTFAGSGVFEMQDNATPDKFNFTPHAAQAVGGRLYLVGQRSGTSAGPFVLRMWE
jgi:hypothetical protein